MTIKVTIKHEEPNNNRPIVVTREANEKDTAYRDETVEIAPGLSREFMLWGPWTLTVREKAP